MSRSTHHVRGQLWDRISTGIGLIFHRTKRIQVIIILNPVIYSLEEKKTFIGKLLNKNKTTNF